MNYVVDGDTIRGYVLDNAPEYGLRSGDYMYVKLVGINAPELDEFKGAEAKEFLENLVSPGDNVRLLVDPKEAFDAYGRILAVVFAENSGRIIYSGIGTVCKACKNFFCELCIPPEGEPVCPKCSRWGPVYEKFEL